MKMYTRTSHIFLAVLGVIILMFFSACSGKPYGTDEKTDKQIEEETVKYIKHNYGDDVSVISHSTEPAEVAVDYFLNEPIRKTAKGCELHTIVVAADDVPDSEITILYNESYVVKGKKFDAYFMENYSEDKAEYVMLSGIKDIALTYFPSAVVCDDKNKGDYDIFVVCSDFDRFCQMAGSLKSYCDKMRTEHYASYSVYIFSSEQELKRADINGYIKSDMIVGGLAYGKDVISLLYPDTVVEKIYGGGNGTSRKVFELSGDIQKYKDSECIHNPEDYQYIVRWYSCEPNEYYTVNSDDIVGSIQIFGVI